MSVFGPSGSTPGAQAASGDLQFDRAEYQSAGTGLQCSTGPCAGRAGISRTQQQGILYQSSPAHRGFARPDAENGNVPRALLYGSGAAVAGCLLFYAVSVLTGFQFGLIAIAVGYLVGKAVRKGSGSLGGRKYQVMAVLLTYISIASTNLPAITKIFSEKAQKMEQMTATAGSTVKSGCSRRDNEGGIREFAKVLHIRICAGFGPTVPGRDQKHTRSGDHRNRAVGGLEVHSCRKGGV